MATIPSYGNFKVTPQARGEQPWSTDVPKVPGVDITAGLGKVGDTIDKAYTKYMDEQDDARVTDALTNLRRKAIDLETGEGGYRSLLGENALKPDTDGRGLVERVDTSLHEYGSELAASLTPRQQKKFAAQSLAVYNANYGGVSQHVMAQDLAYRQNTVIASNAQLVESGAAYAGQPDRLRDAQAQIGLGVRRLAELQGLSPEQTAVEVRKQTSSLYMNAIASDLSRAASNPDIAYRALATLNAHSKDMLGSDVAKARTQIDGYIKTAEMYRAADDIANLVTTKEEFMSGPFAHAEGVSAGGRATGTKAGDALFNGVVAVGGNMQENTERVEGKPGEYRYGFTKLSVEQGQEAAKQLGIPWDLNAFLHDKAYNVSLGAARMDAMEARYAGDMQKAIAAYRFGSSVVDDAVKQAESAGTPGAWFYNIKSDQQDYVGKVIQSMQSVEHTAPRDADGNEVSAFNPGYAARTRTKMTKEEVRNWVDEQVPRAKFDPVFREQTINAGWARVQARNADLDQKQQERVGQALDALYEVGGDITQLPAVVWQGLTWQEQQSLHKAAAKMVQQDDTTTNINLYMKLMEDDAALLGLTQRQVKNLRPELSKADYQKLTSRWVKLKAKAGQAADTRVVEMRNAQTGNLKDDYGGVPMGDLKTAAIAVIPEFSDFLKKDPEAANQMLYTVSQVLALNDQMAGTKTKGVQNIGNFLRSQMRQQIITRGFFGGEESKVVFALRYKDLPDIGPTDARTVMTDLARKRLGHEPSENEVQQELWRLFLDKRYAAAVPGTLMSDPLIKSIQDDAKKQKVELSGPDLLRAYILARLKRERFVADETTEGAQLTVDDTTLDPYNE